MIVNQHNNSARLGALSSAILASFLSFGVNANVSTVSISPIVVNPFGESKQGICETYNARVKVANAQLRNLGLGEIESQNTCTHVPLSRGQIEVSLHPFKYNIYPTSYNTWAQMEEKVDITHELELIMLSGGGETHYVVYTTGGAQLREQHFYCIGTVTPRICSNAPQYRTSDLKGNLVASWNAWGANQLNNVFNNVKTQIQTVDAKNNPSVPGGNGNSRYWRLDDYFPKTSTQNKTLDIAKSTSISFGVEGSTGKEASVNFAVGYESGFSTEETVMTVHGTELTSDTGSSSEFKLNVHAIWPLSSFNSEVSTGSSSLVDNRIGQSAWRDIDFSSFTIWRETVNQGNCNPDEGIRNQIFRHTLSMDRGQYDADHNSDVLTVVEGSTALSASYSTYSAAKNFSVGTKCVAGKSGKWYRVHETGTLNR
ncbi:hypothetical protein MADA3029_1130024 [Vibrio nigripulchritudo MADA3029]|uniref:hypothetical protein n=1 Tax=Vibrio nigripulchritudo TaxID=28173 RepID=UPI0003B191CD|nr:hypothetical protein [Vibrio nigripulchritudo]CCN49726.1 hypothetical protein VIBNIMADA3020_780024 [Vibrio nigripulchritudo MADA3020]CCN54015.1 hypothetical protein VIBNIMADA3021_490024 [Vibrio nigripulchritudo MADA3021]CCN57438.1 hypothetical protein MADA3029_1130024 [Vibrio nigripulchritudo MADA3029]